MAKGIGVKGHSEEGRGGSFYSQKAAQIRLEPNSHHALNQLETTALPMEIDTRRSNTLGLPEQGEVGDLYTLIVKVNDHEPNSWPKGTLWLCVNGYGPGVPTNRIPPVPAQWVQLLTGTPVAGTL